MKNAAIKSPVDIVTDRFGLQTRCWAQVDESGSPALSTRQRADQFGTRAIDPQAVFEYLHFHCIPSPRTIFKGVARVPPGHRLVLDAQGIQVRPVGPDSAKPETKGPNTQGPETQGHDTQGPGPQRSRRPDFDGLQQEFLDLLRQSVADQLDGSLPGCFLSGGTDSSTVTALIGLVTGRRATAFSIGFDAPGYDEMSYARIAARAFGADHREHYVTPEELIETIPKVAASFDQPFGNSSAVPTYCCARVARASGVTKLLAGDGGDELFGGNSRYAQQKVLSWYGHVPAALRTRALEPLLLGTPVGDIPLVRKVASYVRQARVPMPDRMHTYNLLHHLGIHKVLEPRFLAQVDTLAPAAHQRQVWAGTQGASELDRMLAYDWRYTLAENDLVKVKGAADLAGVALGFPLLDERLVAFSQRLPDHYKLRGLKLRWFFKQALREVLPPQIIRKRKQGFGLPFGLWATQHSQLLELAEDSVQGLVRRGIVRAAFADELIRRQLREHPGYYGEMIWVLMMLEQWLRAHAPDYSV